MLMSGNVVERLSRQRQPVIRSRTPGKTKLARTRVKHIYLHMNHTLPSSCGIFQCHISLLISRANNRDGVAPRRLCLTCYPLVAGSYNLGWVSVKRMEGSVVCGLASW